MDYVFLLDPHRFQPPFSITIVNKTTAAHKRSRLKSDQILCGRCGQLFCGHYKIIQKGTENEL